MTLKVQVGTWHPKTGAEKGNACAWGDLILSGDFVKAPEVDLDLHTQKVRCHVMESTESQECVRSVDSKMSNVTRGFYISSSYFLSR